MFYEESGNVMKDFEKVKGCGHGVLLFSSFEIINYFMFYVLQARFG